MSVQDNSSTYMPVYSCARFQLCVSHLLAAPKYHLDVIDCEVSLCRFASIAKLAGEQLGPYIAKLVPKLYRYQYDPNARVRDSMSHIWRALVAEPKKTVDEHFGAILQELLKASSPTCA